MSKSNVAWFVFNSSVKNPVVMKWRVTLVTADTFKYKGKMYSAKNGEVVDLKTGFVVGFGKIRKTDKQIRQDISDAECRRACDPTSERYWAM